MPENYGELRPTIYYCNQQQIYLRSLDPSSGMPLLPVDMSVFEMQRGEVQLLLASLFSAFGVEAESSLFSYLFNQSQEKNRTDPSKPASIANPAQNAQMPVSELEQYMRPPRLPGSEVTFPESTALPVQVDSVLKNVNQGEAIVQLLKNPALIPLKLESLRLMRSLPRFIISMIIQMKDNRYGALFRTLRSVATTYSAQYAVDPVSIDSAMARWNDIMGPLSAGGGPDPSTAVDYSMFNERANIVLCRLLTLGYSNGFSKEEILTEWVENNMNEEDTVTEMLAPFPKSASSPR